MAEMRQYAAELRSLASGRGTFEVQFDHYAEVPHAEAQQVIAAARSDAE
jgi:elongation factor G